MSWKNKVKKATSSKGGGPYVGPGKHLLRLDMLKEIEDYSGSEMVIAEFVVEETDSDDPDMRIGNTVARVWNMSGHLSAPGNFKAFLCAAFGDIDDEGTFHYLADADLTDEMIDLAVDSDNPLNGTLFYCVGHNVITKTNKQTFTKCRWELREHAPAEEDAA